MASSSDRPSKILLDEFYTSEDDRFLTQLGKFQEYNALKNFAERWVADARPSAREQLIAYLDSVWDRPGHEVIVKRVFKHVEANHDTELLTHFLVAFDRLVRRTRFDGYSYDFQLRRSYYRQYLCARPNRTIREETGRFHEYSRGRRTIRIPLPDLRNRPGNRLFTYATRAHLRRRTWRYFRQLSYRDADAYVQLICDALRLYRNSDFQSGEAILDNWSLMHACFYHSDQIRFSVAHTNVVRGGSLANLDAAPYQPTAWETDAAGQQLWMLVTAARSVLVRTWTIDLLKRSHQSLLQNVQLPQLVELLAHPDSAVQEFAAELFSKHAGLPTLGLDVWLQLIDQADYAVLPLICDAMKEHVDQQRLSDQQLVELTCARPVPVARLGLEILQTRHAARPLSADLLTGLASAKCEFEAERIAAWALSALSSRGDYQADRVVVFFDAMSDAVRRAACGWFLQAGTPGRDDPTLWAKLAETPMDDVRFALVERLKPLADGAARSHRTATLSVEELGRVWSAVVLCVHRGSRAKPKAIRQLAAAINNDPSLAEKYLPVIAYAARSIRGPEYRAALSSLALIAERHPTLQSQFQLALPEFQTHFAVDGAVSGPAGGSA